MKSAEKGHGRSAKHRVMEMCNDEIRVMEMSVGCQNRDNHSRETTDSEKRYKRHGVQHRSVELYGALVHGRHPVKHFYGGRNRDKEGDDAEYDIQKWRLPGDKEMMSPYYNANRGDGDTRPRHGLVSEDCLPAERGDKLAHDTHSRQHHDVNCGMRIKPEKMLEQHRVAAVGGIEYPKTEAVQNQEQDGDAE